MLSVVLCSATLAAHAAQGAGTDVRKLTDQAAQAYQAGRYDAAARDFRRLVELDPANGLAWHFLGQSLQRINDLPGARTAYQQGLLADPTGPASGKTRTALRDLPLPDPLGIMLPSGLTLFDTMGQLERDLASGDKRALLRQTADLIRQTGPYPKLREIQAKLIENLTANLTVEDEGKARAALPAIAEWRQIAPDNERLLQLEAMANHQVGNFEKARGLYSQWLQSVPADHPQRESVVDNVAMATQAQRPRISKPLVLPAGLPEHVANVIKSSPLFQNLPDGKPFLTSYTSSIGGRKSLYTSIFRPLGGGLFQSGHRSSWDNENTDWSSLSLLGGMVSYADGLTDISRATGRLFPLAVGNTFSVEYTARTSYSSDTYHSTNDCRVESSLAGVRVHPNLPGEAFVLSCSVSWRMGSNSGKSTGWIICSNEIGFCPFSTDPTKVATLPNFGQGYSAGAGSEEIVYGPHSLTILDQQEMSRLADTTKADDLVGVWYDDWIPNAKVRGQTVDMAKSQLTRNKDGTWVSVARWYLNNRKKVEILSEGRWTFSSGRSVRICEKVTANGKPSECLPPRNSLLVEFANDRLMWVVESTGAQYTETRVADDFKLP